VEAIRERISQRTTAIVINSPSNPTGCLLSESTMKGMADLPPYVISDEIYHGLVYEGEEHSMLEFSDRAFVLNGFSKLYAMTGYRLGYLIAPQQLIRPIQKMQQNFFICAGSLAQRAGIAALRESGSNVGEMRRIYDQRRRFMIKG
jgi:(5-formylfuran-3-yl)methyl phosphate transaminase